MGVFVGLNPMSSKQQIEDLNSKLTSIKNTFVANTQDYLTKLREVWYSPNAASFSKKAITSINDIDEVLKDLTVKVVEDSCGAFNRLANSQGLNGISIVPGPFKKGEYLPCEENNASGDVGMVINDVNTLTEDYLSQLERINDSLQDLPKNISLYDREGTIAGLFDTKVGNIKTVITDSINYINQILIQEVNEQIELSKQGTNNAVSSLSEGNTTIS